MATFPGSGPLRVLSAVSLLRHQRRLEQLVTKRMEVIFASPAVVALVKSDPVLAAEFLRKLFPDQLPAHRQPVDPAAVGGGTAPVASIDLRMTDAVGELPQPYDVPLGGTACPPTAAQPWAALIAPGSPRRAARHGTNRPVFPVLGLPAASASPPTGGRGTPAGEPATPFGEPAAPTGEPAMPTGGRAGLPSRSVPAGRGGPGRPPSEQVRR